MTMLNLLTRLRVLLLVAVVCSGCSDHIGSGDELPPLQPASTDANAGSWQMIVLTGPTQFNVPAPLAVTDPAYVAELAAIKSAQRQLTAQQRA